MSSILNATTTSGLVTSADNSGSLQLQTNNGTTAVTIDTSQRVLVGTESIGSNGKFQVGGGRSYFGANGSVYAVNVAFDNTRATAGQGYYLGATNSATPDFVVSDSGGTERMRITSDGNLLFGKTATGLTTAGAAFAKNAGGAYLEVIQGTTGVACVYLNQSFGSGTQTAVDLRFNNTQVGTINVSSTTTSYNTSSDYRLKENISPMVGALDIVQQLKPVTYNWKADGSAGQGFIAHELAEVVPDCVTGEKDAVETYTDEDGNEQTRPKYQGIDTSFLVATLTAAIQELKAELDATKAEVQALKGVA